MRGKGRMSMETKGSMSMKEGSTSTRKRGKTGSMRRSTSISEEGPCIRAELVISIIIFIRCQYRLMEYRKWDE